MRDFRNPERGKKENRFGTKRNKGEYGKRRFDNEEENEKSGFAYCGMRLRKMRKIEGRLRNMGNTGEI